MTTTTTSDVLPVEESLTDIADDPYRSLVRRLSQQSVVKHFDAYADVEWDAPHMSIDPADPRWEFTESDTLGRTAWYKTLPQETRASLGLAIIASQMKTGLEFERVLKRGLLEFAGTLPNGAPEFRYAYHEVIEEAHHSLMFQEFVNRTGFDVRGLNRFDQIGARFVVSLGRRFPALFFIFVLGGEDPIDYVQREVLHSGTPLHPLLERIMRIHVTEEARHLSFARHYLKKHVPELGRLGHIELTIGAPLVLSSMAQMMLKPSRQIVRQYQIPKRVIREAFTDSQDHKDGTLASLRKVRRLCEELGILGPAAQKLWRVLGLYEQPVVEESQA
jgi:hypothetical protein